MVTETWIKAERENVFNPCCTKVFGTHTFYQGGGEGCWADPSPMVSKMVSSTNFNFGRPLGLSIRGKKLVELMIQVVLCLHGNWFM